MGADGYSVSEDARRCALTGKRTVPMVRAFVVDKHGELGHYARHTKSPCFGPSSIRTPRERVKMRKTLWILLAAMAVAVAAPYAHADSYTDATFNFTVTNGSPNPTGSFVFDDTTGTYTSFAVNWDGATFNIVFLPVGILGSSGTWCTAGPDISSTVAESPCSSIDGGDVGDNEGEFDIETGGLHYYPNQLPASSFTDAADFATGSYTLTETTAVTTPEPSSLALILLGLGALALLAVRKRIGQGLPQAS